MSRTYRRKKVVSGYDADYWCHPTKLIACTHWLRGTAYRYLNGWFEEVPTEQELKKTRSIFMSDGYTSSFKEPGPSWFRRMDDTRPGRRKNTRELQEYMLNPDYEPMCFTKGKLDYWT